MSESDIQNELVEPGLKEEEAWCASKTRSGDAPWEHEFIKKESSHVKARRDAGQAQNGLSGLAFSGGGIRSATFGLGVLESLKEKGILHHFDYLSTVSGGGYVGAWLSANCQRKPDWLRGDKWGKSIAHLRRYSNYLSPQVGFFSADTWSMFMVWIRNALLIQMTIILALCVLLLLPRLLLAGFVEWPATGGLRWITVALFIIAVVGISANLAQLQSRQAAGSHRLISYRSCGWPVWSAISVLCFAYGIYLCVTSHFNPFQNGPVSMIAYPIALLFVIGAFASVPFLLRVRCAVTGDTDCDEVNYGQMRVQIFIVLPMIITAYLLAAVMWGLLDKEVSPYGMSHIKGYGQFVREGWKYWPFPLGIAFVSFLLLAFCSLREPNKPSTSRIRRWLDLLGYCVLAVLASLCCMGALHLLLSGVEALMLAFKESSGDKWNAFVVGPPLLLIAFSLAVTLLIGLMGRASLEGMREWWSRLAAWLCIYAFAWTLASLSAVYGPLAASWMADTDNWKSISALTGWLAATVGGLLAGNSASSAGETKNRSEEPDKSAKVINAIAVVGPYIFIAGLLIGVAFGLHFVLWNIARNDDPVLISASTFVSKHWAYMNLPTWQQVLGVALVCLIALTIMVCRVGVNEFSLNAFYRNRLARCYLGATRKSPGEPHAVDEEVRHPQVFTQFDDGDDLPMAELGAPDDQAAKGPIHLVNCALNLGGSSDLDLHTRHSASYTITPYGIGSAYLGRKDDKPNSVGYQSHEHYRQKSSEVTLAQAISVSGAAASPNMGYHTSPAVAFMLTMFNVRLGWWFPNPARKDVKRASPPVSLRYLLVELFGMANENSNYLMISDGGHFENLGVYELIRRRCRLIVASDAECDPDLKFEGLGTLIRMCEVDFDVSIHIRSADIGAAPGKRRYTVGWIDYKDGGPVGLLIYLKASLNGEEETSIRQYQAAHTTFPHESTGDQFYGEDQFESYRRLGKEIADEMFGGTWTAAQLAILESIWPNVYPWKKAA